MNSHLLKEIDKTLDHAKEYIENQNLVIEALEDRIEKLKQELAEAYKEGYREGFLAAREQQHNRFK